VTDSRGVAGARLVAAAPWVFVLFWSTGFIVARYGTDDAAPLTFLTIRLVIAAAVLGVVALVSGAPRPDRVALRWAAVAGVGLHALYLGGVFVAISWGMPSGVSALIAGLHPVLTTAVARVVLHERVARLQWIGIALGVGGVSVVVVERLAVGSTGGVTVGGLIASAISVLGMVGGTLLQRRTGVQMPLLWGTVVQYTAASAVLGVGAVIMGWRFEVTTRSVFAMAWALIVLSFVAVLIMLWLLQRHAAAKVSSLFFLTPALSTIEGAILFGERLGPAALVGLVAALAGVALALRSAG
jgi:drug/metabolite transporter (DMT)-like permease